MARVPMVTRTIVSTKVAVMCVDVNAGETCTKVITLPRTYKDNSALLKQAKKAIETDELKVVHVVDKEEQEQLYGMTEQQFIELASVLPPRTEKETEQEVA